MSDANQANACINYHQNSPAQIKRVQVFLQHSTQHKELKPDQSHYFVSKSHTLPIHYLLTTPPIIAITL